MKSIAEMTLGELAAFVQSHLNEYGIEVVLSGGACVSIYSSDKYVSLDLDLINVGSENIRVLRELMRVIGFHEERRYFKHPDSQFLVEFPPGPLTIGEEPVSRVDELKLSTGILRIISPTDCVKDRLAAFYHWGDRQSLSQAILVAQDQEVEIGEIRRWSRIENKLDQFEKIEDKLASKDI